MNVGTKDLKNRLSHFLRLVRDGDVVNVMDRGEVIAQLRRVESARSREDEAGLSQLARDGVLTRGRGRLQDVRPVRPKKRSGRSISQILLEDRG
jgi:antitoxin (DNA-binding transcriptional repressor) of toxin-antitoxin stability system